MERSLESLVRTTRDTDEQKRGLEARVQVLVADNDNFKRQC